MSFTIGEVLGNMNLEMTDSEVKAEEKAREDKHRAKTVVVRPDTEFKLRAITTEEFEKKKYQKDPTDDLVELTYGLLPEVIASKVGDGNGYLVWCQNTMQLWYAHSELCLNQNFIYREDLNIFETGSVTEVQKAYTKFMDTVNPAIITKKRCYILDNPAAETYEVYYDAGYPSAKYGKATPNGMFIHKCDNRFHRDMRIMEFDKLYAESSKKRASEMIDAEMGADEAIIVSDGSWMKETCASAFYYLDNTSIVKLAYAALPTEPEQAVLIAEINGATHALRYCMMAGKKKITYYYDNTSIVNIFRNRKTEYIEEVKAYKSLVEKMDQEGYEITFVELHPKTGDDRATANAGLMFFHNYCDKECRELSDIFKKSYKAIASSGDGKNSGKSYKQVKSDFQKKGPKNNGKNGNNRYQKRI